MIKQEAENCPICNEGHVEHHIGKNDINHKGVVVNIEYSTCDHCGSEYATPSQTHHNKLMMNEAIASINTLSIDDLDVIRK